MLCSTTSEMWQPTVKNEIQCESCILMLLPRPPSTCCVCRVAVNEGAVNTSCDTANKSLYTDPNKSDFARSCFRSACLATVRTRCIQCGAVVLKVFKPIKRRNQRNTRQVGRFYVTAEQKIIHKETFRRCLCTMNEKSRLVTHKMPPFLSILRWVVGENAPRYLLIFGLLCI